MEDHPERTLHSFTCGMQHKYFAASSPVCRRNSRLLSAAARWDAPFDENLALLKHRLTGPHGLIHFATVYLNCSFCANEKTLCNNKRLTNYKIARFLSHIIHTRILNPALLPVVLRTVRATLFPNNGMGPPRQIPNEQETQEIKRRCASSLLGLLPPKVAGAFLASNDKATQHQQVEAILECLEDAYLNKHLIFQVLELVVLRLVPELEQQGIQDLIEERTG